MSAVGIVSRVTPVHTAMRNCTRDGGRPFEVGNQVLISSHRKLLSSKAMVVNVAEKPEQGHQGFPFGQPALCCRQVGCCEREDARFWNGHLGKTFRWRQ